MLKPIFYKLLESYIISEKEIEQLWMQIEKQHTHHERFYHNLSHLEHLYTQLLAVKDHINNWDIVLFALFYHDYYYNIHRKDNEKRSATKAFEILTQIKLPVDQIEICHQMILSTLGHQTSTLSDINYFTDADLSILGSDWESYQIYFKSVRLEYSFYPDFMYKKGRSKMLKHFLDMPSIFKTAYFYQQFEQQAKFNISRELDLLQ